MDYLIGQVQRYNVFDSVKLKPDSQQYLSL